MLSNYFHRLGNISLACLDDSNGPRWFKVTAESTVLPQVQKSLAVIASPVIVFK